ncbi:MAG: molybdopterin-dependent oxidoreductase [Gammaproteobacteria bacterium]
MLKRRDLVRSMAGGLAALAGMRVLSPSVLGAEPSLGPDVLPAGTLESSFLHGLAGKKPLIKKSYRPPNYETPVRYFAEAFTPNELFFVRYHLSRIPELNAKRWKLRIAGEAVKQPFELTMEELRRDFETVEINALCQCSGNRRGLFSPHVPGIQWGYGAMGNARWKGVRLKDILNHAGLRASALEVSFNGADAGLLPKTPDFIKSLPLWKATDENTLIALEMNGQALPHWNGYPARLIVPGWTATYWVKQLTDIEVISRPFQGFWMKTAYRIPKGRFALREVFATQEDETTTPITEMLVNSLIINPEEGQRFETESPIAVQGIAWDGGYGIARVQVSVDGGTNWSEAALGRDLGRFSWRQWSYPFKPQRAGNYGLRVKATNSHGDTQAHELIPNPAGYHHNLVQRVNIRVV